MTANKVSEKDLSAWKLKHVPHQVIIPFQWFCFRMLTCAHTYRVDKRRWTVHDKSWSSILSEVKRSNVNVSVSLYACECQSYSYASKVCWWSWNAHWLWHNDEDTYNKLYLQQKQSTHSLPVLQSLITSLGLQQHNAHWRHQPASALTVVSS